MRLRLFTVCSVLTLLACHLASAFTQLPKPPADQVEAMKKLQAWVGHWKGTGWAMMGPGQRSEFRINETIQSKVSGSVLLVEGLGKSKGPDGAEAIAHEALGVVSYDGKTKRYRMRTHDLRGQAVDTELKLIEGSAEWGFKVEDRPVSVRFTIKFDDKKWNEVGEVTLDEGKTWMKFMEMTLAKQKEA
jgi:hypothetical protein